MLPVGQVAALAAKPVFNDTLYPGMWTEISDIVALAESSHHSMIAWKWVSNCSTSTWPHGTNHREQSTESNDIIFRFRNVCIVPRCKWSLSKRFELHSSKFVYQVSEACIVLLHQVLQCGVRVTTRLDSRIYVRSWVVSVERFYIYVTPFFGCSGLLMLNLMSTIEWSDLI